MRMYYVIEETMRQQQRDIERRAEQRLRQGGGRPVQRHHRPTLARRTAAVLRGWHAPAVRSSKPTCARAAGLARCS